MALFVNWNFNFLSVLKFHHFSSLIPSLLPFTTFRMNEKFTCNKRAKSGWQVIDEWHANGRMFSLWRLELVFVLKSVDSDVRVRLALNEASKSWMFSICWVARNEQSTQLSFPFTRFNRSTFINNWREYQTWQRLLWHLNWNICWMKFSNFWKALSWMSMTSSTEFCCFTHSNDKSARIN